MATKTKTPKLTEAQRRVLMILDDDEYLFMRGPQENVASRLESLKLVEGELKCFAVQYRNGFRDTKWRRAYRITEAGQKAIKQPVTP